MWFGLHVYPSEVSVSTALEDEFFNGGVIVCSGSGRFYLTSDPDPIIVLPPRADLPSGLSFPPVTLKATGTHSNPLSAAQCHFYISYIRSTPVNQPVQQRQMSSPQGGTEIPLPSGREPRVYGDHGVSGVSHHW